jgi:LacI family transcriptional regulator
VAVISPNRKTPTAAPELTSGPATIKDVAKAAGVAVGTVSRVLNGKQTVGEEVRRRVQAAIDALRYHPNIVARSMRGRHSHTVGCIVRDVAIMGLARFVRAAHDVLADAGFSLLLSTSEGDPARERHLVDVMVARQVDALLIAQHSEQDRDLAETMRRAGIPVVLFDRMQPDWADHVIVDHTEGTRLGAEKLIALGHRRIALLTGRETLYPARARVQGFLAAHEQAGLAVDRALIRTGSFAAAFGFEQTSLLVNAADPVTAIIAGGIDMLPGVVQALRVNRRAIPGDMSLIAALKSDLADLHQPAISVAHWDYGEVGRIAARIALERIHGQADADPRHVVVPSELLLRDSCAPRF